MTFVITKSKFANIKKLLTQCPNKFFENWFAFGYDDIFT